MSVNGYPAIQPRRVILTYILLISLLVLHSGSTALTAKTADNHSLETVREIVFEDDFSNELNQWAIEAPPGAVIDTEGEGVFIDPRPAHHRPPADEGVNFWCRVPAQGDWNLVFDLEPVWPGPTDGVLCNLLFMFDSRYDDGRDLIRHSPLRTGHYVWMHTRYGSRERHADQWQTLLPRMHGYSITYYRINPIVEPHYMLVARRNPDFHLLARKPQSAEEQWNYRHTVRIERRGSTFRLYQNDDLTFEFEDTGQFGPVLNGGYWGFRTFHAALRVYHVRLEKVEAVER